MDTPTLIPAADLQATLARGTTLITATNRLAQGLRRDYEQRQAAAGAAAWSTPDLLPWSAWLQRQHTELADAGAVRGVLLQAAQERLAWERIVSASSAGRRLLRPEAAADAAMAAYRLIHEWQLSPAQLQTAASSETEVLLGWIAAFDGQCTVRDWLPRVRLPQLIAAALAGGSLPTPTELLFAGFDDLPPAQSALLDALRGAGTQIAFLDAPVAPAEVSRLAASDAAAEMALAARWVLARVRARPTARIGIVVPELAARRAALQRQLTATLQPETLLPGTLAAMPWHEFSLGLPLVEHPPVQDALLALTLLSAPQPLAEVGRWLRSPFCAGAESEWAQRGALDARLRRHGTPRLRLAELPYWTRDPCPLLTRALGAALALAEQLPAQAPPSAWAEHFDRLLAALGWPGERPLDSAEYQQVQRLRDLYTEFAALDRVSDRLNFSQALAAFRRLATDTLFQPEGRGAPVQVLGVLEAGGLAFDHLWVMGLDDSVWPPAAAPHPLLPAALQRQLGLPHASAERELDFARRLTARLRQAAPEVIFSHPLRDGERDLRPSPLLADLAPADPARLGLAAAASPWQAAAAAPLETLPDGQAPPAPPQVRGGTALIAAQAACPFSAVAAYRLLARPLEEPQHAPDGRQTGGLVHRALHLLWHRLGSSAALAATPADRLQTLVGAAADRALAEQAQDRPDLYPPRFHALERTRLGELLQTWLALEAERAPFTVSQLEHQVDLELGELQLQVRADRIDTLADGRLVVIDYKTGKRAGAADWTSTRPDQPQVPLYCIASEREVAGAVIARVRNGDCAFVGSASADDLLPGVRAFAGTQGLPDWPAQLAHWRSTLSALAAEVHAGLAVATPARRSCEFCPFPPLCRRNDGTAATATEVEDDA